MGKIELKEIVKAVEGGQYEHARNLFDKLREEPHEAQFAAYLRALTHFQLGQIPDALVLFSHATKIECLTSGG